MAGRLNPLAQADPAEKAGNAAHFGHEPGDIRISL
jgi:hypothetical protein